MPAHEGSDPSDSLPVVGIFREVLVSCISSPWTSILAGEAGSPFTSASLSDSTANSSGRTPGSGLFNCIDSMPVGRTSGPAPVEAGWLSLHWEPVKAGWPTQHREPVKAGWPHQRYQDPEQGR